MEMTSAKRAHNRFQHLTLLMLFPSTDKFEICQPKEEKKVAISPSRKPAETRLMTPERKLMQFLKEIYLEHCTNKNFQKKNNILRPSNPVKDPPKKTTKKTTNNPHTLPLITHAVRGEFTL